MEKTDGLQFIGSPAPRLPLDDPVRALRRQLPQFRSRGQKPVFRRLLRQDGEDELPFQRLFAGEQGRMEEDAVIPAILLLKVIAEMHLAGIDDHAVARIQQYFPSVDIVAHAPGQYADQLDVVVPMAGSAHIQKVRQIPGSDI